MLMSAFLAAAVAVAARPAGSAETVRKRRLDVRYRPSAQAVARFEFLRKRKRERDGYVVDEGDRNETTLRLAPAGHPSWEEQEKARAAWFDKRFGPGAYDGIIRFSADCYDLWEKSSEACSYTATADVLQAAYRFVELEKDREKHAAEPGYREREAALKDEMLKAVEQFRPKPSGPKEYARSFAAFSDPILKKLSEAP
ncbi:MAG: hypothetical protein HY553_07785 [Elusimicrobia bacterium]|nr:hypothetical protein [Elusimicrobiota bacterium]